MIVHEYWMENDFLMIKDGIKKIGIGEVFDVELLDKRMILEVATQMQQKY